MADGAGEAVKVTEDAVAGDAAAADTTAELTDPEGKTGGGSATPAGEFARPIGSGNSGSG